MVLTGVRRIGMGAMVGGLALVAAACGSSSNGTKAGSATTTGGSSATTAAGASGSGASSSAKTETVNVGVLPIADVAPLYLGIKQGFFAEQHLNVVPHSLQGGAAVASAVVGGSLEFGFGATANLVLAKAHNLPLQFIANGDQAAADASGAWSGILVSANSGITSISQLAGKTVAANAVQGQNELALDTILKANGVQPSSVHVVALAFPTMPSALESGQVQAVTEVEPFVSAIKAKGGKLLSPLFEGANPSEIVAGYFASTHEIQSDPALVQRFVTALNQSLDYAQANPAAARAIIPSYTSIPAAVAAKMTLPVWSSTVDTSTIQSQEKMMQQLGWISSLVPIDQLVWSGAKH